MLPFILNYKEFFKLVSFYISNRPRMFFLSAKEITAFSDLFIPSSAFLPYTSLEFVKNALKCSFPYCKVMLLEQLFSTP